ncbi:hypothetical protein [Mycoplasmopsis alligatoris]|uniref:Uncharacterized protein n=1 Tax=Mycoplasmopsis alligatoris A21JP2 TaxID=747682 RepID=D4XVT2_9BACT|nr:hypothetical protein [Mycoplasmopsis alligatoris]EFF41544.1 hypothetical protein MALL_0095 [Mycoplasmopsis alligatoris A21JP2]
MKEKVFKYLKMVLVALLSMNLIGLYFIYQAQFAETKPILDFLPGIAETYAKVRTQLSWIGLALLVTAWILWEFAISKSGNKILGMISVGVFAVQMIVTLNLVSDIALILAFGIMSAYIVMELPWKNAKKFTQNMNENAQNNKENNSKLKKLFRK